MTSVYQIIDIAALEAATTKDYSTYVDSAGNRKYTDTHIEAWISKAERMVVGYCKKSFDSSAPNEVILMVTYLAEIFANNQLIKDGLTTGQILEPLMPQNLKDLLDDMLSAQKQAGQICTVSSVEDW